MATEVSRVLHMAVLCVCVCVYVHVVICSIEINEDEPKDKKQRLFIQSLLCHLIISCVWQKLEGRQRGGKAL